MRINDHPHRHFSHTLAIAIGLMVFLAALSPHIRASLFRGLLEHRFLSGLLVLFGLTALSLLWSVGQQVDTWAFLLFNLRGDRPRWLDRVMLGYTRIASGMGGLAVALIVFLVDGHRLSYILILGTLSLWIVVELVKGIFNRSRPFVKLLQTRIVGTRERGLSFPSGHTSQAFFMAALINKHFHFGLGVTTVLFVGAFLVAVTRMYVGAHYPRDVLAGGILGGIWAALGAIADAHFR